MTSSSHHNDHQKLLPSKRISREAEAFARILARILVRKKESATQSLDSGFQISGNRQKVETDHSAEFDARQSVGGNA